MTDGGAEKHCGESGTMRPAKCELLHGTKAGSATGRRDIERHRHRYEFNNKYITDFRNAGMIASGTNPESGLVEIIEIPSHRWFVGVQFHAEYSSTVIKPHPLFIGFVRACISK